MVVFLLLMISNHYSKMPPNKPSFKDILAELKKNKSSDLRPVDSKGERRYFLIVCEGERTEPNYFNSFKKRLPKNVVDTIDVSGEGENTISVVTRAITAKQKRDVDPLNPSYDKVYVVFDRDNFPPQNVNHAVELATQNEIIPCLSNESFELWYLLHFQYLDTCITRHQYIDLLSQKIGIQYLKNDPSIVDRIRTLGNVNLAIKHAKKLVDEHKDKTPCDSCPSTQVYIVVEELLAYLKEHGA